MHKKEKNKKIQFLTFGLCSLLAMLACMAVLVITVHNIDGSTSADTEHEIQSKTELTGETAILLDYLKGLTTESAENKFIKADIYTDISVDDACITVDGNIADRDLLIYAKNKMAGKVDSYYPDDIKGVFGKVYDGMPVIDIAPSDVVKSSFSVGEADENGNPVYNTDTGELIDKDYYFITLSINESADASELFAFEQEQKAAENFAADLSGICRINNSDIAVSSINIYAKINRITDEIEYIKAEKIYKINADISFINEFEIFGDKNVSFEYKVNRKYEYRYAGISFAETLLEVEPGKETVLTVNAVIENDSEYTVSFDSSDTAVATVDEMGYVKGIKASDKPVRITVTLEYLGKKFTDECTVYVGNGEENPNS